MSYTYKDLQDEVKRRSTRDQGGTQFDTAAKNLVNFALFRIANEAPFRVLRRLDTIDTVAEFTTGTVSTTVGSKAITFAGASLITNGVITGRRISLPGSSTLFTLDTITGENAATIDLAYDGTTAQSAQSFTIYGQEYYNLPIQTGRVALIWHEGFGYPFPMHFVIDREFISSGLNFDDSDTPELYRMWGEDWTIIQPRQASVLSIASSDTGDTGTVTIFGTVSGFPDSEDIALNGSTVVPGLKSFSAVERVSKAQSSMGRITITANTATDTIATIPVGDTTGGVKYKKIQVYPAPDAIYKLNVLYYKEPYRLVNDNDIHELGQDFDELIILLATSRMQGEQSKKDMEKFFTLYANELSILRRKNADKLDQFVTRDRPSQARGYGGGMQGRPHRFLNFNQVGSRFGPASYF